MSAVSPPSLIGNRHDIWIPSLRTAMTDNGTVPARERSSSNETMETAVARDQLSESINAVIELRKGGKIVHAADERAAEPMSAGPSFAGGKGPLVKEAVESGRPNEETADNEWP